MTTIAEIRKRLEAATPGPWGLNKTNNVVWTENPTMFSDVVVDLDGIKTRQDVKFIAHAPTDIAFLLEKLESANKIANQFHDFLEAHGQVSFAASVKLSIQKVFGENE